MPIAARRQSRSPSPQCSGVNRPVYGSGHGSVMPEGLAGRRVCATGILPVLGHGQDGHGTTRVAAPPLAMRRGYDFPAPAVSVGLGASVVRFVSCRRRKNAGRSATTHPPGLPVTTPLRYAQPLLNQEGSLWGESEWSFLCAGMGAFNLRKGCWNPRCP
jgi:hypothetical protein